MLKYTFVGNFTKNLFKQSDFWLKTACLRNLQKIDVFDPKFFEKG